MSNEKPNVTVIYQDAPRKAPGLGAILIEVIGLALFLGVAALIGSCGVFR